MKKLVLSIMLGTSLLISGKAAAIENKNGNIQDVNASINLSDTIEIYNTKLSIDNIYRDGTIEYVELNNGITLAQDYLSGEFSTVNSNSIKVDRVICASKNIDWIVLDNNTIITYDENNQNYYIEFGNFLENV